MYASPAIPMDSSPGIQSSLGMSSESKAEQKLYQSLFGHVTLDSHDITRLGSSIHTIGVRPTSGALSSWLCVSSLALGTRKCLKRSSPRCRAAATFLKMTSLPSRSHPPLLRV